MNNANDYFCRMEMPLIIYINERPLLLTGEKHPLPPGFEEAVTLFSPGQEEIAQTLALLEKNELPVAVLRHQNVPALFETVKGHFTVYEAAGGLITNEAGEILLMFRRGKWDLPKGKLDEGETLEACALREVQEETGLQHVNIDGKITETFHYYPLKDKKILKQSHWYRMFFTGTELTVPQIEEDILDIQWIRPEHLGKYMAYSYENIREVFLKAGYKL